MKTNFQTALAHSSELDSQLAVHELIQQAKDQLGLLEPNAGILYAGIDCDHQLLLDGIMSVWPHLQLVGCTTDGEFSSAKGYEDDSCVLTLIASETCRIVSGFIDNTAPDLSLACSGSLNQAILELGQKPDLCILFSDVLRINGEQVIEQLSRASGNTMPIVGGIAGDSWRFGEAKQFINSTASADISTFLLLAGPFDYSFGMDSGWEPYGEMGTITRSKGNVVYEINHKPALAFYQDILGEGAKPTLELPIAIHDENGTFRFMRTSFENYDGESGAITYLGNVPVNHKVRITMVSRESILRGAAEAMDKALRQYPQGKTPSLALCFSCSARRIMLGTRTQEECRLVQSRTGQDIPLAGFYTYGEICPGSAKTGNEFHNETFVAVLLG